MEKTSWCRTGFVVRFGVVAGITLLISMSAPAQDEDFRLSGPVPAPLRFIATEQKSQLDTSAEPKRRARLSLDLAEARLAQAESLTTQQDFTAAAIELGNYQGLIHESIVFLQTIPTKGNLARDLFKRMEIALRTHCPRLETMRRNTPLTYATNIKEVIRFAEDSRDTSLNCFFGDTVMPNKDRSNSPSPSGTSHNDTSKQTP